MDASIKRTASSVKARRLLVDRLTTLLTEVEDLRPLIGRRVVGVEFNGEGEGTYTLNFDDRSEVSFSSSGDDMTVTLMTLSDSQKSPITK